MIVKRATRRKDWNRLDGWNQYRQILREADKVAREKGGEWACVDVHREGEEIILSFEPVLQTAESRK